MKYKSFASAVSRHCDPVLNQYVRAINRHFIKPTTRRQVAPTDSAEIAIGRLDYEAVQRATATLLEMDILGMG